MRVFDAAGHFVRGDWAKNLLNTSLSRLGAQAKNLTGAAAVGTGIAALTGVRGNWNRWTGGNVPRLAPTVKDEAGNEQPVRLGHTPDAEKGLQGAFNDMGTPGQDLPLVPWAEVSPGYRTSSALIRRSARRL